MISRRRQVAFFFGLFGARGQLLRSLAGFRLGTITRGGLLPVVDLLLQRRLGGIIAGRSEAQLGEVRYRLHNSAANALGLKEGPEIRGFDVLADGFGLGALAQRLRQRKKQRDHRDQQRDLLVGGGGVLGMLCVLHAFLGAHDSSSMDPCQHARLTEPSASRKSQPAMTTPCPCSRTWVSRGAAP